MAITCFKTFTVPPSCTAVLFSPDTALVDIRTQDSVLHSGLTLAQAQALDQAQIDSIEFNPGNPTPITSLTCLSSCTTATIITIDFQSVVNFELTSHPTITNIEIDVNEPLEIFDIHGNTVVTDIIAGGSLQTLSINCAGCTSLLTADCGGNDGNTSINCSGCTNLNDIDVGFFSFPNWFSVTNVVSLIATGCALTVASVNMMLRAIDHTGINGGTIDISGGTSAAPTGLGAAAVLSLVLKGWTVTTN